MRKVLLFLILILGIVVTGCSNIEPQRTNAGIQERNITTTAATPLPGFVYAQGTRFYIDGKPFYFAGCNAYDIFTYGQDWMTNTMEEIETKGIDKAKIDLIMGNMASDGVKVLRTWGFDHETWMGFEPAKGKYCEPQFLKFDYILESAKKNGIKVIIVLENFWEAYGGIDTRLKWAGLPSGFSERWKFFKDADCKTQYKNYAQYFVGRTNHYTGKPYSEDPGIFSWELMNEPRYQGGGEDDTGLTLRAWTDEMAAYIKSIDPNHMVSTGIEGHESRYGFGGNEGNPFIYLHQSPYIDFCTAHPYPDESWANLTPEQSATLVAAWVNDAHNIVGKPFVLEEFNTHNNKEAYWKAMLGKIESMDAAGDLFWNYTLTLSGNFDIKHGDSILTTVFKPHAAYMANKSPISSSSYSIPSSAAKSSSVSSIKTSSVSSASSKISSSSSSIASVSSSPDNGKVVVVPGKVEAEDYSAMSGIQTESCSEGTLNVGWVDTGDWFEYTLNVTASATYSIDFRVASIYSSGVADILVDGANKGSIIIPNTGGWQTWTTVSTPLILTSGTHKLRLFASGNLWNINYMNFKNAISSISSSKSSISSISSASSASLMSRSSSVIVSSSKSSISSTSSAVISSSAGNSGLKIRFFNGSTAVSGNQIYGRYNLVNTGSTSIALSTVKVRYYYTIDSAQAQSFWCDWTSVGTANVTGTFGTVTPAKTGADTYFEFGFTTTAGNLAPGASLDVQTRIAKADWSNYNQSNDYSFNATASTFVDWNKVTATVSGTLVWGVLP